MFSLFAFHSARVSVVRTKQPTEASFRAIHGVTTSAAPASDRSTDEERSPRGPERPRDERGEHEREQCQSRVAEDREADARAEGEREEELHGARQPQRQKRDRREQQLIEDLAVQVHVVPDEEGMERRDGRSDDAHLERDDAPPDLQDEHRRQRGEHDVRDPHDEPVPLEHLIQPGEEPGVQRLRVAGRPARNEAERAARDERAGEAVALLDKLGEDLAALGEEHRKPREDGRREDHGERDLGAGSCLRCGGRGGRQVGLEPGALPELQHEEAPQAVPVISVAPHVLGQKALDGGRAQLAAHARSRSEQNVSSHLAERPAEPGTERDPEPLSFRARPALAG